MLKSLDLQCNRDKEGLHMQSCTLIKLLVQATISAVVFVVLVPQLSFGGEDKEIYLDLDAQIGIAYENGRVVPEYPNGFQIISGFDGYAMDQATGRVYHKPTPKGARRISSKTVEGYSRTYRAEMPYAMGIGSHCYIHGWSWSEPLPPPGHPYSSHGCVSVDLPVSKWLYDWAPVGTIVYIQGQRTD
jgi:lipoprotein-anchoring transpeptidase ErfK/SrfK